MKTTRFAAMHCSLARGLDRIGDWWTPLILRDLFLGVRRFDELVLDLGLSRNLLTTRLRRLVAHGLVERVAYQARPRRHEYHLSDAGRDLVPALLALTAWGDRWAAPAAGPPLYFEHATCGHRFTPTVVCSCCGAALDAAQVVPRPGPGGAARRGTRVAARKVVARAAIDAAAAPVVSAASRAPVTPRRAARATAGRASSVRSPAAR